MSTTTRHHDLPPRPPSSIPTRTASGENLPPPPPPPALPHMHQFGGDSWRPNSELQSNHQQREFSFRYDNGRAPQYPQVGDRRPTSTRSYDRFDREGRGRPYGNFEADRRRYERGAKGYGRGYGGRKFPATADRPLLRSTRGSTPEQLTGMAEEEKGQRRFMVPEDISDSEEADMDESELDENYEPPEPTDRTELDSNMTNGSASEPPRKKQVLEKPDRNSADGESVPKWSNPDPYTVLPPPDESQKKRRDVVKLIRKARIAAEQESARSNAVAANDDFISLNFEDDTGAMKDVANDSEESDDKGKGVPGAPSGPRKFSHLSTLHGQTQVNAPGTVGSAVSAASLGPPPPYEPVSQAKDAKLADGIWPPPDTETALGSRKRTRDDQIKAGVPTQSKRKKGGKNARADGSILSEWQVRGSNPGTPWCMTDYAKVENVGYGLHQEICDFYDFVKPREYEDIIRNELLQRLRHTIRSKYSNCDLQCFGSFAAGLYLPNADMDLVVISQSFMNSGRKQTCQTKTAMRGFADFLCHELVPERGSVEMIFGAKVPLIKFVDRITGLKVDLSFENDTGIIANGTFARWKAQFPAMPVIVTLVKQFLMMRGLNEVVNGGLGGFSVTCLVTSLLQNMPEVQCGALVPEEHLGFILMEFFNLYGKEFNTSTTGIQLSPPGYFDKRTVKGRPYQANKLHRLAIIDPNKPDNDISGGTRNILTILEHFAEAYKLLQQRLADLQQAGFDNQDSDSILGTILAGDYSAFETQRNRLRRLYEERYGKYDEKVKESMKGCFTNSPIIQDEDFGGAAARTRDQGRRNPPESYRAKPKSKPQNATIENAARNRASAMKREFPQIKDIPDAISKSKRRALIAQWASTGSTPPIDTLSIHTNAGGNALSTRKDPTQRISAKRPDSRRTGGRGGASTSDPIEID